MSSIPPSPWAVRPLEANDSVPPLLASPAEAPRQGRLARVLAGGLLAIAVGAGAMLAARAISPPPAARTASVVAPDLPRSPPPSPTSLTMDDEDDDPATLEAQRLRLFGRMRR